MMQSATSLTSTGLRDWILQRFSAVILGLYFIFLMGYFGFHPQLNFDQWQLLFSNNAMRFFTLLAILSLVIHSWIGIWTVLTDYIKPTVLRLLLVMFMAMALLGYLAWGIAILWRL